VPEKEFYKIDWSDGKIISIESMKHFNQLIKNGYEITAINYSFTSNLSNVKILLVRQNEKIIANANNIDEYIIHLVELYDFTKKKPMFIWVPDTSVYWEFEKEFFTLLPRTDDSQPIIMKQVSTSKIDDIYNSFQGWINGERFKRYGITKLSEIFSLVCVVQEKDNDISRMTFGKERLTLKEIGKLIHEAKRLENSIALSFFILGEKSSTPQSGDVLIGIILYDLKNDKTLAFNILSLTSFIDQYGVDQNEGLHDVALHLFDKSLNDRLHCHSFTPIPLDSPWYTVLPWLCYAALLPMQLDNLPPNVNSDRRLTIPQFFTFGYSIDPRHGNSFNFSHFASNHSGRATCILNFNEESTSLKYIMRFDQSPGQPLVHLDFSYHDIDEHKLNSHRPLDFELVYEFNTKLFVAMMCAGIFDSYFNTIIFGGIKGIQELANQNAAFLTVLKWVWTIETAISWLDSNKQGYTVLEKLFNLQELDEQERKLAKEMHVGGFTLIAEDEMCNVTGLSNFGYIVLQRHWRGQHDTRII
jgi:hypothetical protein